MFPSRPGGFRPRVKADPSAARLEQLEAVYGAEDSALRLAGAGDISFGASPLLRATLSARQLDADKFAAKGNSAAEPIRLLPGLRALMAAIPQTTPITGANRVQRRADHAGRPSAAECCRQPAGRRQILSAKSWAIDRLEFRAPGATRVTLNGSNAQAGSFTGALSVDSVRSGCAGDLAAGPRRGGLSQPEAAAAARRPDRGRGSRGDRSHEGRDRRRRRRRAGCGCDGQGRVRGSMPS